MKTSKKGNTAILGVIIFILILIIAVILAWSLGYVHFGKQTVIEDTEVQDKVEQNEVSNNANTNTNTNTEKNDSVVKNEEKVDLVHEAYKKHNNFNWVKQNGYARAVKVEGGKVILDGQEKEVTFAYGTPIITTSNAGQSFDSVYVINNIGEAYINNLYEVNYDYQKDNFKKINFSEKVVDMGFVEDSNNELVGPYFMTESGKVLKVDGVQYK